METVAEVQEEVFGKIETEDIAKLLKEVREQKESTSLDEIEVLKPYVEKVNSLTDIGDLCASSYVALGMLEDEAQVRFLKLVESVLRCEKRATRHD